ncbi:MAG: hypothetical protein MUC81_04190 [Bacteroidia bacterium]|jgi:methionyl-tRNA formyltransferase|nr:hypothetical protein [Bacteroidia bacterium]
MKVSILCNTDTLAAPSIHYLVQQDLLSHVFILSKSAKSLMGTLLIAGVKKEQVVLIGKNNFEELIISHLQQPTENVLLVYGFPWLIPIKVINKLSNSIFNFHFGLFPKYKGADPIFWQIKNGESQAGLTVHRVTKEMDAGPVVIEHKVDLQQDETYGMHCIRMGFEAITVLQYLLTNLNNLNEQIQTVDTSRNEYWLKPTTSELEIDWATQTSHEIIRLVNAANPKYGGITTYLGENELRLLEVSPIEIEISGMPEAGTIVYADIIYGLIVACCDQRCLRLQIIQTRDGYLSGSKLFGLGVRAGQRFSIKEKNKHKLAS